MRTKIKSKGERLFTTRLTTTVETTVYNKKVEHLQSLITIKQQNLEDRANGVYNYAGA